MGNQELSWNLHECIIRRLTPRSEAGSRFDFAIALRSRLLYLDVRLQLLESIICNHSEGGTPTAPIHP